MIIYEIEPQTKPLTETDFEKTQYYLQFDELPVIKLCTQKLVGLLLTFAPMKNCFIGLITH